MTPLSANESATQALIEHLRTVRSTFALDDRALEAIYTIGYGFLDRGELRQARVSFEFLTAQAPGEARFWAGLGYSLFDSDEPGESLVPFGLATQLDPDNAGYMLGLAGAYAQVDQPGHAAWALAIAEAMARRGGNTELAERARARLELMGHRS